MPHPAALSTTQPTQHALLIAWGYFAQSLALVDHFQTIPIPQKHGPLPPQVKLLTLLLGLLTGCEYLSDLSLGPTPVSRDPAVAAAWGVSALASASGISRTLAACPPATLQALQDVLDQIMAPFLHAAVADLRARQQPFQLDIDLTGRPVSSSSQAYPDAAFGYMDGAIRLGYQLALICLQTPQWGRQWLVGRQHPGDTVSSTCLLDLLLAVEARLGCHPRRRVELVAARLAAQYARLQAISDEIARLANRLSTVRDERQQLQAELQRLRRRITRLRDYPVSPHQDGPSGVLTQTQRQYATGERRSARLTAEYTRLLERQRHLQQLSATMQTTLHQLEHRHAELAAQNAAQPDGPACRVRMDAGFCSGANLTALLELGYDVETKVGHPAIIATLRERCTADTVWTRVGRNAEMVGWTNYYLRSCPYPVTVGLERFHTPQGLKYSVLLRNQEDVTTPCPDLREWFSSYNARQTIEAGNKQSKTVFKVQHLWSQSAVGMQIQVALTLFAANFVGWAGVWLRPRLQPGTASAARAMSRPKHLVRVAANSPAEVETRAGQVLVRFSPLSGLAGTVIHLAGPQPIQLALDLYGGAHF